MRLLEEIKNRGLKFEVVEPIMRDLGRYDNEALCKMLLSQNLDSRVVVKLKDGTCKVYELESSNIWLSTLNVTTKSGHYDCTR